MGIGHDKFSTDRSGSLTAFYCDCGKRLTIWHRTGLHPKGVFVMGTRLGCKACGVVTDRLPFDRMLSKHGRIVAV